MANVPCKILVFTEDAVNFPIKIAKMVMRQLFQYGVKEINEKGNAIFISLTYSPKEITLKKKFGNLPIHYIRTRLQNDEELKILEETLRKYKYNIEDKNVKDHIKRNKKTKKVDNKEELLLQDAKEVIAHDLSQNQTDINDPHHNLSNIDKKNKSKRKESVWDDEAEEWIVMIKKKKLKCLLENK